MAPEFSSPHHSEVLWTQVSFARDLEIWKKMCGQVVSRGKEELVFLSLWEISEDIV